jgi:hypothetical protein
MRLITGFLATAAITSAPLALAAPAYAVASGTLVQSSATTIQADYTGVTAGNVLFCPTSIAAASCTFSNYTYLMGGFGASLPTSGTAFGVGASVYARATTSLTTLPSGTYNVQLSVANPGPPSTLATLSNAVVGSGGAPSGDSSTAAVPAPTFEISLTPTDGTTCVNSSQSATGGTWLALPRANDCTPPASKAGATLLGWSTTPNFPIDIAQRQVNNGWGVYETFNSSGAITSVFIPAGRATFLSGTNTLYAIWNK